MRVLGLAAGPRRLGNSERLLEAVLAGAEEAGAETRLLRCADLAIEGCRSCGSCASTGECVVDDDMQPLYAMLLEADYVVLATPIFFMGVPAQGKRVIDRCQALWSRRHLLGRKPRREGRRGLLVATAGGRADTVFSGARDTAKAFFAEIGVAYWGELLVRPLEAASDVERMPGALKTAREAGRRLVRGGPPPAWPPAAGRRAPSIGE